MTLAHAYAQLGIPAQVRAVDLAITNVSDMTVISRGTLTPRWEDSMIHGHTIVWLPTLDHLIDVTAEQFPEIAALDEGPVVAGRAGPQAAQDPAERVHFKRKHLRMTYTLAPLETTVALLDHPVPRASMSDYRRRGVNVATAAVAILADSLPRMRLPQVPHRRAAALIEAVRDLPEHPHAEGRRFLRCRWRIGGIGVHTGRDAEGIPTPRFCSNAAPVRCTTWAPTI
ncbi:hypothetical protein E1292_43035 [Nonomuraea deserti]|uniref:Uncharacterized protein n=1 Tax=Nonomuraea deserti TaxID=1848322 RepID=A0A4R4UVZ4_9ACTN|nr:hypothetical protein [Nonomuraea deserti]TDC91039.1 hypothetical protein E1292_43035 [Nonomuraea deserti]